MLIINWNWFQIDFTSIHTLTSGRIMQAVYSLTQVQNISMTFSDGTRKQVSNEAIGKGRSACSITGTQMIHIYASSLRPYPSTNHHPVLPSPTTSILIRPVCIQSFPQHFLRQWHHPVAEAAGCPSARLDQELSTAFTMRIKRFTAKQRSAFCEIVHSLCFGQFSEEVKRKKSDGLKEPNRHQVKKG